MTNLAKLTSKADIIGATASVLCFIHCLATPFLFIAQAGLAIGEESHSWWWGTLDIVFLSVSFFAVYWSTRTSSKKWMKSMLWTSWLLLAVVVLNEKLSLFHLMEEIIYVPTLSLVFFHLYNRKYCQCDNDQCCIHQKENIS